MYVSLNSDTQTYSKGWIIVDWVLMYFMTMLFIFLLHLSDLDQTNLECKFLTGLVQFFPVAIIFISFDTTRNKYQNLLKFYLYEFVLLLFVQSITLLLFFFYVKTPVGEQIPTECSIQLFVIRIINGFLAGCIGYLVHNSGRA